jgi:hypothetical protein
MAFGQPQTFPFFTDKTLTFLKPYFSLKGTKHYPSISSLRNRNPIRSVFMKTVFLSLVTALLAFSPLASASLIKANLSGSAQETRLLPPTADGHGDMAFEVIAEAKLKEVSRSESSDEVTVYLMTSHVQSSEYLAILHDAESVDVTFNLNEMSARGESSLIRVSVQILGDDDQIRKATGVCVLNLDQTLECSLTPTFNAFGLLKETSLNLTLN